MNLLDVLQQDAPLLGSNLDAEGVQAAAKGGRAGLQLAGLVMTFIFFPLTISLTKSLTTLLACWRCSLEAISSTTSDTPSRSTLFELPTELADSWSLPRPRAGLSNLGSSATCETKTSGST
eukprot:CAMPEP_0204560426 /NCGR_PEP_ID=MMETSP0661-20131031/32610_1 /ASSEMBLY_ACC=CAM_ASM_000606 /TAXON_ID=109239 /ORGANISM="Alexandrium margalefi, Strain AMGDE01CS-322" /LENGTH=120 /DNA_ID=CAMNT_0051567759 /DNA_START=291 /DNA_END=650 /DNA_ORIENTATION=+